MTIQCFDDNSTQQMSPATATSCDNLFIQENHPTSASDRINPSVGKFNFRFYVHRYILNNDLNTYC